MRLVGKEVRFMGKYGKYYKEDLVDNGIYTPVGKRGKMLYPKDGLKFMKALKMQYTGSAVRASDVMTVPD